MGAVTIRDDVQRVVDGQVALGHAVSAAAFLEEAALRFAAELAAEQGDIRDAALRGAADADAGRFTAIASEEDRVRLHERLMARVRDRLAAEQT